MALSRTRRTLITLLSVSILVGVTALPAAALTSAPDQTWRTKPQDKSWALASAGNMVFVGGKITMVYDAAGNFVRNAGGLIAVDRTTGAVLPWDAHLTKSSGNPQVNALAVSADGNTLYIGGRFTAVGGEAHKNFAAVAVSNGAVISSFDPIVSSAVKAILVGPSKLYIGGDFKKVDHQPRDYLAALNLGGDLDPSWTPSAGDGGSGVGVSIHSLKFAPDAGATVFVGGRFRTIDGSGRMAVARVDATTGNLHPWAIPNGVIDTGNQIWDMLVTPTRLFGGFGNGPNYVAAFRLDNGNTGSQTWRINTVGNVQGLSPHPNGTQMFVAGHFGTGGLQQSVCNGQNLRGLMLVTMADSAPSGRIDCSWLPQITPFGKNFHGAWPLLTVGNQVWAGVKAKTISGVRASGFARWTI